MKKKRVAGLILLLPLGLLAACGGGTSSLAISPNWYANTTTSQTDYSKEELEYAVTFTPPSVPGDCTVSYEEGTYRATLETVKYDKYADGSSANVYLYKTRLDITGRYTYEGTAGEPFTDSVDSTVYFRTAGDALVPISSSKEIVSTSPVQNPGSSLYSSRVHIRYDITYNTASALNETLQSAEITSTLPETDEVTGPVTVKIKNKGSFFDNEEVLFAIRGLDMSAVSKFYTIDPRTYDVTGVTFSGAPEKTTFAPASLTVDEAPVTEDIQAYSLHFYYDSDHSGPARTAVYAAKVDMRNNKYRNVLLRLEDPIPYGYGTLVYTLRSAKFAN